MRFFSSFDQKRQDFILFPFFYNSLGETLEIDEKSNVKSHVKIDENERKLEISKALRILERTKKSIQQLEHHQGSSGNFNEEWGKGQGERKEEEEVLGHKEDNHLKGDLEVEWAYKILRKEAASLSTSSSSPSSSSPSSSPSSRNQDSEVLYSLGMAYLVSELPFEIQGNDVFEHHLKSNSFLTMGGGISGRDTST